MRIRFLYADETHWEGDANDVASSPEKGVLRMWSLDAEGRSVVFSYDDFYYIYYADDGWVVGSGTPKREYYYPDNDDQKCECRPLPVMLPKGAVVRHGETVSDELAEKVGLLKPSSRYTNTPPEKRDCHCG